MVLKNVLIATKNRDKFDIIRDLLIWWSKNYFKSVNFYSLADFNIQDQADESGDVIDRAFQKAHYAHMLLHCSSHEPRVDLVIGSDDGMRYHNEPTNVNSKEVTQKILYENLLSENDILTIVRAFVFLNGKGETVARFETSIPFRYKKPVSSNVVHKMESYPLSQVVTPINDESNVASISSWEMTSYYLDFCKDDFALHLSFIARI